MFILFWACLAIAGTVDRVAAVVNDDVITLSDVYDIGSEYIASAQPNVRVAELEVLDSLIMRKLIEQEVVRLGQDVTDEELRNAIGDVAKSNGLLVDQLKIEVERSGLLWEEYELEIRESLRQMKFNQLILQPRIQVDEAALQDAYRRLKNEQPIVIDLSAIVLKNIIPLRPADEVAVSMNISVEEAQALLDKTKVDQEKEQQEKLAVIQQAIKDGLEFETAAGKYDESGLGGSGGKMGSFAEGQLREELNDIAFSLEKGQLSEPIITDNGIILLYVSDRYRQPPPPFDSVRPQLLDTYYASQFEVEMDVWFETTKRRAAIDIKLKSQ